MTVINLAYHDVDLNAKTHYDSPLVWLYTMSVKITFRDHDPRLIYLMFALFLSRAVHDYIFSECCCFRDTQQRHLSSGHPAGVTNLENVYWFFSVEETHHQEYITDSDGDSCNDRHHHGQYIFNSRCTSAKAWQLCLSPVTTGIKRVLLLSS